ncbi:MAG TPA: ferredoxin [Jatrophihabitans sp.]|uniref:ferredoxin n=1 Tax=Jatrophihabitans sp. TaxID=1932789 RepID=UPI002E01669D|nr:ferredoxin [Jatrophihabitans sp.]
MKVSVDNGRCEAQGQCAAVQPDFFTLDEDGYSNIGQDKPVPAGLEKDVENGVGMCPMAALSTTE